MKTQYSVIFASINAIISERLSVGLILTNGEQNWFAYSSTKLSLMKHFFTDESYKLVKTSLRNMEHALKNMNVKVSTEYNVLFDPSVPYFNVISEGYLSYLNRYSNTTLTFGSPVEIDVPASNELFQHLYTEMVFTQIEEHKQISPVEKVKTILYPTIEKNVNLDRRIETGEIKGLVMPVDLDFIGRNEIPVVGRFTDFNQPNFYLDSLISSLFVLMKTFELNNENGKYFVIGNEPDIKFQNQHQTWKEIQNSKLLECVSFEETERITEYINDHNVQPFFSSSSNN
ncbi:MAG: hypothetical protein JXR22_03990 [Prolixibacteraceae bacterium]|nr:hypothetical protein [Prolixibacteraceae bacterium]